MGVTKDFIAASIADAFLPTFRRPVEDIIYETLDRRQIPTRTDFKELRDLVNTLRGQVNGAIQSLRTLAEQQESFEEELSEIQSIDVDLLWKQITQALERQASAWQEKNDALQKKLQQAIDAQAPLVAQIQALENRLSENQNTLSQFEERLHSLERAATSE